MLYRPNFCCHCGEKVVRAKWTPLTSRRFCDFCAIEQKQHDLLPRAAIVIANLFGAAGVTGYLSRSGEPTNALSNRAQEAPALKNSTGRNAAELKPDRGTGPATNQTSISVGDSTASNTKQREFQQNSSTQPVYFCGAL